MATPAQIAANKINAKKGGRKKGYSAIAAEKIREYIAQRLGEELPPIVAKAVEQARAGDDRARNWLTDRGLGKAPQSVELTGKDGSALIPKSDIDISKMATEVAAMLKSKKT